MGKFILGLIVATAVLIGLPWLYLRTGGFDVAATARPGTLERHLASMAIDASLERRAPDTKNPVAGRPDAWAEGLDHYRENCATCHGAPDVDPSEIGKGLNPRAPRLWRPGTQKMSDGELFWVVKNGIRMTGMPAFAPTHSDQEIWELVAFLRHLPDIGPDEKAALREATEEHHHAAGEEGEEEEGGHEHGSVAGMEPAHPAPGTAAGEHPAAPPPPVP